MGVEATRNSFRAAVLGGVKPSLVVTDKKPRQYGDGEALNSVKVPRAEVRRGNHRGGDRHRLSGETATAVYKRKSHVVDIVNLSRGGAMIRCDFEPMLWDMIELRLGEGIGLEGAVRWIKDDNVGLEFAHETRLDCDPEQRAAILLAVIQRSFGDEVSLDGPEAVAEPVHAAEEDLGNREEKRHPLIWMGEIHYAHDSNPARLRNVSEGGALLEVAADYPLGAEIMLDLGDAGLFSGNVQWACGDQIGIRFLQPFDLACLANARPDLTPHSWNVPGFLTQDQDDDSPWHEKWARSSIAEIRSELEGYLKR